jgi:hypothetical protein
MVWFGASKPKIRTFDTLRNLPDAILFVDDKTFPDFLLMFESENVRPIPSHIFFLKNN